MMTRIRKARRVISMKVLFSTVTVAIVLLTATGILLVTERNSRLALQQEVESRLVLEARHLALISADALLDDYPELTLCPVVGEMIDRQPQLTLAVVLDHEDRIQGHPDVRQLGKPLPELSGLDEIAPLRALEAEERLLASDAVLAAAVPVRHAAGQRLGTAVVVHDRAAVDAMLASGRRQVLATTALMGLIGVLLAVVVVRRLLAPFDQVRSGLERMGRGDLQTPIALRSRTELGRLSDAIDTMASDLARLQEETRAKEREVIATQSEVIHTLGEVVESRSHETGNHIDRVALGAEMLARLAGLPASECEMIRLAAPMHDVGKIGIPDAVLNKKGKLTDAEFDLMKSHTEIGHKILSRSHRPLMKVAANIARQHHERWDGRGYPDGLSGEDIHIHGRLVAVVDVFDALTSDRCYRPAMRLDEALKIMADGRGTQFDPRLLDLFFANMDEFSQLMERNFNAAVMREVAGEPVPAAPLIETSAS
jgi:HD-GYP domain-containing protein (c-di-GMP phosphodiesterase class II)